MDEDSEIKKLLLKNIRLTEENNKILRKIHRSIQWGRVFKALYWVIIIGTAVGTYYFLQPYIESLQGVLKSFSGGLQNIQDFSGSLLDFGGIFEGAEPDNVPKN